MSDPPADSLRPGFFDRIYAEADDPWSFATSPYEQAKYAATLAVLPRPAYRSGFEIGCSVGVLTTQLAERCAALLSVDVAERALAQARARCRHQPWVQFERVEVPRWLPGESFDLIVVSEVAYYWSMPDLERAAALLSRHLEVGGHLRLVHWTPFVDDYPITGDQVHDALLEWSRTGTLPLRHVTGNRMPTYRLDLIERFGTDDS